MFISLNASHAQVIRQKLLETLNSESDKTVRNKISDAVAEVARQYSEQGESWADLLSVLFQLSMAPDAGKRETAFRVFTTTPGIIEKQHEEAVAGAFTKGFKDDSVAVRHDMETAALEEQNADVPLGPARGHGGICRLLPQLAKEGPG